MRRPLLLLAVLGTAAAILIGGFATATAATGVQQQPLMWHPASGNSGAVGADAKAELIRRPGFVAYRLQATDLKPGHVYTAWIAVIANPAACTTQPCSPPGFLLVPATEVQVTLAGGGGVVPADGKLTVAGVLPAAVAANGWFEGRALANLETAEIHLFLRDHGPASGGGLVGGYREGCADSSLPPIVPPRAKADGSPGTYACHEDQAVVFN